MKTQAAAKRTEDESKAAFTPPKLPESGDGLFCPAARKTFQLPSGRTITHCFTGIHQVELRHIAITFKAKDFGCVGEDKQCCRRCLERYNLKYYLQPLLRKQWSEAPAVAHGLS